MCPQVEISGKQELRIEKWVGKKGGRVIDDPNNGIFQYAGSFRVWEVGGEPLVIYSRTTPKPYVGILYCSERQANELKEERIVKFPKTKKPQKL